MISIYRILINLILLISPLIVIFRLINKKEDPKRFLEKFTLFSKKRKNGKLIWFHAVSVGELLSIISLIKALEKNKKISQILITTSTLTSSKLFTKFKFKKVIHQYYPVDNNFLTKRFLKFWKPCLAIFVDSEIWPNMLLNLKKESIKKILLNARVSKKSYLKWKKLGSFSKNLFQSFDYTFPQNQESQKYLKKFNVKNIEVLGNLKFSQNDNYNKKLDLNFRNFIKSKKIWCATSTHPGEEEICAKIHTKLLSRFKNLVLIIIPRHTERAQSILKILSNYKLFYHLHSNKSSIDKMTNIYLVDTYGETNLFFDICKTVFIGKSLTIDGGQNPLEPARHNCSILHGPHVSNFTEIYAFLDNKKISYKISNENNLYNKIYSLIKNKNDSKNIKNKLNSLGIKILNNNKKKIESLI